MAVISIVFAVVLLGVTYLYMMIIVPLGPIAMFAVNGIWFIPPIFISYILRRPGAALISLMIMGIVTVPFSIHGWMELPFVLTRGLPIEFIFLITRYRNYRLPVLMISGFAAGIIPLLMFWMPLGINLLPVSIQMIIVAVGLVNGAISGLISKLFADAVAKTGVLSNYAVGQEHQQEI